MKYNMIKSNGWIIKLIVVLITYHLSFITSSAQTFTQRIQKATTGEGSITIHQGAEIDELVNGPDPTAKPNPTIKKVTPAKPTPKAKDSSIAQTKDTPEREHNTDTLITPKRTFKTVGYRVQVLAGGNTRRDRQRAEQAGRSLRSLFPGEEVYVHFYSPRWICRLGNYRTYDEAHEKMLEVRKLGYDAATVVKGRITVTESIK